MKLGTKVKVTTELSAFFGMTGTVVEPPPGRKTCSSTSYVVMDSPAETMDADHWIEWPLRFWTHELEVV